MKKFLLVLGFCVPLLALFALAPGGYPAPTPGPMAPDGDPKCIWSSQIVPVVSETGPPDYQYNVVFWAQVNTWPCGCPWFWWSVELNGRWYKGMKNFGPVPDEYSIGIGPFELGDVLEIHQWGQCDVCYSTSTDHAILIF